MDYEKSRYLSYMGRGPERLVHWEHWSNPDAETYLTGIDYYEHPRLCRLKLQELYPQLGLAVPETDDPMIGPGENQPAWADSRADSAVSTSLVNAAGSCA